MPGVRMQIGNYTFALSPRDNLPFDFSRNVSKLDTIGAPTYQDLGVGEKKLQFSGSIISDDAWTQAEMIESLMDQGLPQTLLYGPIQRTVRIDDFAPKYIRSDRVDYTIDLIIIPPKSGYNAPQQPSTVASVSLPAKAPPATTSTASIAVHMDSTYTVRQGDSLWVIAQRVLGTKASANDIATLANSIGKANGITNPKTLQVGQKLKIPSSTTNVTNANTAYSTRQTAIASSQGVTWLQSKEAAVRFKMEA